MNSVQQFEDHPKQVGTVPMDYECFINNQTEENNNGIISGYVKESCCSDIDSGEHVYKIFYDKGADTSKEICDMKLKKKEQEETAPLLDYADIETYSSNEVLVKYQKQVSMPNRLNNKITNKDSFMFTNFGNGKRCDLVIPYGTSRACSKSEDFNLVYIKSSDTPTKPGIKLSMSSKNSDNSSSSSPKDKISFKFMEQDTVLVLKPDSSATVENNSMIDELNLGVEVARDSSCFLDNEHFIGLEEKCNSSIGDQLFEVQGNPDRCNIDSNNTLPNNCVALLDQTDPLGITVNNSLILEQKLKNSFDADTVQTHCNYNCLAENAILTVSPVTSALPSCCKSSCSDNLNISNTIKRDVDFFEQSKQVITECNSVIAPSLQCSVPPKGTSCQLNIAATDCDSALNITANIQEINSANNVLSLDNLSKDKTNTVFAQLNFKKDGKKQQKTVDNVEVIISNNIPSLSAGNSLTPSKVEGKEASNPQEPYSATTENSSVSELRKSQFITSSQSHTLDYPTSCPSEKHIKSIFNTYVNHRIKTDVYSEEDINNVADKMEVVLKASRKRSYNHLGFPASHPHTTSAKKPFFVVSISTNDSRDAMTKSKMDMDTTISCHPTSVQASRTRQDHDAVLQCNICDTSNPGTRSTRCRNSHVVCQSCLQDEIRLVMSSKKMHLSCPEISCRAAIPLESLSAILPSFVVDLLKDNLSMKEKRASAKAIKKMQGLVVCPSCSCPGLVDEWILQFVCATCNGSCCRYCKASWVHCDEHDGCLLLSYVGTECLKHISKKPLHWNMSITPFNKNFQQVDVPLNSKEGTMVVAYFAKTSSLKSEVVQIFRIQNSKLWEKYILKRKHVEEEIGAAELKEKFLFHGTKAENIVSICGEGFDMRVPTANGAILGKGIYFSVNARYSEKFADQTEMLFLTRVICGWSQQGQRQMTRPQYHSRSRRMYDSCVDNVSSPTMYTVFDNSQCYPEYLIKYTH